MIEITTALNFIGVSLLLAISPGPDILFVMTQGMTVGRKPALIVTLGLCFGLVFHSAAVAFGFAAVVHASPALYSGIKLAGGFYLLYLSWLSFRSTGKADESTETEQQGSWNLFFRGVIMNVTNPKVTVFFLSFLPSFIDEEKGAIWAQTITLGLLFMASAFLVFGTVAVLANTVGGLLYKSASSRRWLDRFAGVVFLLLALNLFFG